MRPIWICKGRTPSAALFFSVVICLYTQPVLSRTTDPALIPAGGPAARFATQQDTAAQAQTKNPTGAMIRSAVFPGWGQWYNGKKLKALIVFGVEAGIVLDALRLERKVNTSSGEERDFWLDRRNLRFWWLGAAILLSMLDAYVDAHLADFDESPTVVFVPSPPAAGDGFARGMGAAVQFSISF